MTLSTLRLLPEVSPRCYGRRHPTVFMTGGVMNPFLKITASFAAVVAMAIFSDANAAAKYTMKIGLPSSDTSPDAIGARMLKDRVERESKGEIEVQIFANASLGGEVQMI